MKVFVCICTCNRPHLLQRTLGALERIRLDGLDHGETAIIVIDNSSTGDARAVCDRAADRLTIPLHFAEETERGISFARNKAVAEALDRGADLIAFIDDDDVPEPDWLLRLVETQTDNLADLVFGSWQPRFDADVPAWATQLRQFRQRKIGMKNKYGVALPDRLGTNNVLISRSILEAIAAKGPVFLPEFSFTGGGDVDFFIRAVKDGAKAVLAEHSLINRTFFASGFSIGGMLRLALRRGSGSMQVARRHCTPRQIKHRRLKAFKILAVDLACLPINLFPLSRLMGRLYMISKNFGALYSYAGNKYNYYQ